MEKKLAMLLAAEQPGVPVSELCAQLGVSRETFYVWKRRFAAEGLDGLVSRSRRPLSSPNKTPAQVEDLIVELRKRLVDKGADVIGWYLRDAGVAAPSDRTIHRVLVRRGLVDPAPQKRPKSSWRRFEFNRPNECWQIDATTVRLGQGRFTVMDTIDDHSRYVPSVRAGRRGATTELALDAFFAGAADSGLPQMVLSDNGSCFTNIDGTPSVFEHTLALLGVKVIHSRPAHPQTCGKLERFHQTLKKWIAAQAPAPTVGALQAQLEEFRRFYNHDRPHRAIRTTPARRRTATPPARPGPPIQLASPARISISANAVSAGGVIGVGDRWQASVGTEYAGRRLTVIRYGTRAVIIDGSTVISRYNLDPATRYLSSGRPRGGQRRRPY